RMHVHARQRFLRRFWFRLAGGKKFLERTAINNVGQFRGVFVLNPEVAVFKPETVVSMRATAHEQRNAWLITAIAGNNFARPADVKTEIVLLRKKSVDAEIFFVGKNHIVE